MDTDIFSIHIKAEGFYKDIADDVEKRYDTSNYEVDRPLSKGVNKKVIGLMGDELGGIRAEFVVLLTLQMMIRMLKKLKEQKNF